MEIRKRIADLRREVDYHAKCVAQYDAAVANPAIPESMKVKPRANAEWHRAKHAAAVDALARLESLDRWIVEPTTRSNAGGNLYQVVRLYTRRKATETPTHSEEIARTQADRLNSAMYAELNV